VSLRGFDARIMENLAPIQHVNLARRSLAKTSYGRSEKTVPLLYLPPAAAVP
jgi:hypothetical protein